MTHPDKFYIVTNLHELHANALTLQVGYRDKVLLGEREYNWDRVTARVTQYRKCFYALLFHRHLSTFHGTPYSIHAHCTAQTIVDCRRDYLMDSHGPNGTR